MFNVIREEACNLSCPWKVSCNRCAPVLVGLDGCLCVTFLGFMRSLSSLLKVPESSLFLNQNMLIKSSLLHNFCSPDTPQTNPPTLIDHMREEAGLFLLECGPLIVGTGRPSPDRSDNCGICEWAFVRQPGISRRNFRAATSSGRVT